MSSYEPLSLSPDSSFRMSYSLDFWVNKDTGKLWKYKPDADSRRIAEAYIGGKQLNSISYEDKV